jgi:hypothetical protein
MLSRKLSRNSNQEIGEEPFEGEPVKQTPNRIR